MAADSRLQPSREKPVGGLKPGVCAWQKSPALIDTLDGRSHGKKKQDQSKQGNTSASTGPCSPLNGKGRHKRKSFWSESYKWVSVAGMGDSVQAVSFRHTVHKENPRHFSR